MVFKILVYITWRLHLNNFVLILCIIVLFFHLMGTKFKIMAHLRQQLKHLDITVSYYLV